MTTRRGLLRALGGATLGIGGLAGCSSPPTRRQTDVVADAVFRGNLRRQGYQDERVPPAVDRDWRLAGLNTGTHTAAKASPLLAPTGDIIVPGDAGVVWAVTPEGEKKWVAEVEETERGVHGTPVVANGTVYVGAYDGALYAFDLATGERLWRVKLGDAIGSSPAYHRGTVYIAVEYYKPSGSVFGVDALDGEVEWVDDRPTNHPHSSLAIDRTTGKLVVGDNDGVLYAWDYPSMEFAWRFPTDGDIKGPVAVADGAAFFGSWDHGVYRVDLRSGEADWRFETGADVMSGPAVRDGTVYVGSHDTVLYALSAAEGTERWSFDTGGWLIGCPAVTPEHVLAGSYDGHLYCVTRAGEDRPGGREAWRADGTGLVTSTPLVTEDAVYYADRATEERSGALYRVSAPADGGSGAGAGGGS